MISKIPKPLTYLLSQVINFRDMETKFNINQKVWIMFNNKPKKSTVKKINIDTSGIYYSFSEPFNNGKESDSGICDDFLRHESVIAMSKEALSQKIFNPKPV